MHLLHNSLSIKNFRLKIKWYFLHIFTDFEWEHTGFSMENLQYWVLIDCSFWKSWIHFFETNEYDILNRINSCCTQKLTEKFNDFLKIQNIPNTEIYESYSEKNSGQLWRIQNYFSPSEKKYQRCTQKFIKKFHDFLNIQKTPQTETYKNNSEKNCCQFRRTQIDFSSFEKKSILYTKKINEKYNVFLKSQ